MIGESGPGDSGGDLGGMMPGGSPPQGGGSGASTWQSLVNDPVSRSALISMGLQLMAGSHGGSPVQNLGLAIGAGAEGAGNTAKSIQSQQMADREFNAKQDEGEKNRASHEKIAQMGSDSRNEVAQIKTEGMLSRAALIHGPQNNQEMNIFSKARTDYMKKEKDNQIISKKSDQQILSEADAYAKEQLRGAREATGVRSQGAPLSSEAGNGVQAQPGASPGPAGTATQSQGPQKKSWDEYIKTPGVAEALKDPKFRQELIAAHPEYKSAIGMYERNDTATDFRKKYYPKALGGE